MSVKPVTRRFIPTCMGCVISYPSSGYRVMVKIHPDSRAKWTRFVKEYRRGGLGLIYIGEFRTRPPRGERFREVLHIRYANFGLTDPLDKTCLESSEIFYTTRRLS